MPDPGYSLTYPQTGGKVSDGSPDNRLAVMRSLSIQLYRLCHAHSYTSLPGDTRQALLSNQDLNIVSKCSTKKLKQLTVHDTPQNLG